MSIFEQVREILTEGLAVQASIVKPESELSKDLGADSIDAMEILSVLEEKFEIVLSEEEAGSVKTVSDLVELITKKTIKN